MLQLEVPTEYQTRQEEILQIWEIHKLIELEQLEFLQSENAPAASWLSILLMHIGSLFIPSQNFIEQEYTYKSMNLTKPRTSVKSYTNYYICIKF